MQNVCFFTFQLNETTNNICSKIIGTPQEFCNSVSQIWDCHQVKIYYKRKTKKENGLEEGHIWLLFAPSD